MALRSKVQNMNSFLGGWGIKCSVGIPAHDLNVVKTLYQLQAIVRGQECPRYRELLLEMFFTQNSVRHWQRGSDLLDSK